VISVCQDKEDILEDAEEVLLEEAVGRRRVLAGDIVDEFQADAFRNKQVRPT
jgi:hypothetical protein